MFQRGAAVGTGALAIATTVCGLLLLSGVGPSPAGTPIDLPTSDAPSPTTAATAATDVTTDTTAGSSMTEPTTTEPTTTEPTTTTTTTTTSTTTTSTTTTTTSTTTTSTTTTTAPVVVLSPVPSAVEASTDVVGIGGEVRFDGTCPVDATGPLGPVSVVIIPLDGDPAREVDTGVAAESWTYRWTAPTVVADVSSFRFQFWCGDRSRYEGGYPPSLERRVDIVASIAATTVPTTSAPRPAGTIPATT